MVISEIKASLRSRLTEMSSTETDSPPPPPRTQPAPKTTPGPSARSVDGRALTAAQLLADMAQERQEELQKYSNVAPVQSSDDDNDSDSPILKRFHDSVGSSGIHQMTNFDVQELHNIWSMVRYFVSENWGVGRGRRSQYKPKDLFFMTLVTLKHGGKWDFIAKMFDMKGPTFERLITRFIEMLSDYIYEKAVVEYARFWTMSRLISRSATFRTHKYALYATDVTFQETLRPSGSLEEGKKYYSGKHKLYGYKVEISVLPNGFAVLSSDHYPGSIADIDIMREMQTLHKRLCKKLGEEAAIADIGLLADEYPGLWAIITDKGYQGASEILRVICPTKRPKGGRLSRQAEKENKHLSSDRIIAENYFGRLCGLWAVLCKKYRWSEHHYDPICRFCVAITNLHIQWHPLRAEDLQLYHQVVNRRTIIVEERAAKRKVVQERYRRKRVRRMNQAFQPEDDSDSE